MNHDPTAASGPDQDAAADQPARAPHTSDFADRPFTVSAALTRVLDGTPIGEGTPVRCDECDAALDDGDDCLVWALRPATKPTWHVLTRLCPEAVTDHLFEEGAWQVVASATVGLRLHGEDTHAVVADPTLESLSPPRLATGRPPADVRVTPHRRTAPVPQPDEPIQETDVECPYCEGAVGIVATGQLGTVLLSCGHRATVDLQLAEGYR